MVVPPISTPKWSFSVGKPHGCWGNPTFLETTISLYTCIGVYNSSYPIIYMFLFGHLAGIDNTPPILGVSLGEKRCPQSHIPKTIRTCWTNGSPEKSEKKIKGFGSFAMFIPFDGQDWSLHTFQVVNFFGGCLEHVKVVLLEYETTRTCPGTYPRPSSSCLWRKSFHFCILGYLGYVLGVCWNLLTLRILTSPMETPDPPFMTPLGP